MASQSWVTPAIFLVCTLLLCALALYNQRRDSQRTGANVLDIRDEDVDDAVTAVTAEHQMPSDHQRS